MIKNAMNQVVSFDEPSGIFRIIGYYNDNKEHNYENDKQYEYEDEYEGDGEDEYEYEGEDEYDSDFDK